MKKVHKTPTKRWREIGRRFDVSLVSTTWWLSGLRALTINLSRPINGSKKSPTCTVPAEHSNARQQADEIWGRKFSILAYCKEVTNTWKSVLSYKLLLETPADNFSRKLNNRTFQILIRKFVQNLQPIKFEQFLLVFWDVTNHSGARRPKPVEPVRDVLYSWDASPTMSTCPKVIRVVLLIFLRPCCQRFRSLASPPDSRPAPNRVFRPTQKLQL